jgi:hypothetical protein
MKPSARIALIFAGLVLLLGIPMCFAQPPTGPTVSPLLRKLQALDQMVHDALVDVDTFERQSTILLILVVAVALFGAVTSALQGFQHSACKLVVVALGVAITTITIINNTAFPNDFRTLKQKAQQARLHLKLADVSFKAADSTQKEEGLRIIEQDMLDKIKAVYELLGAQAAPTSPSSPPRKTGLFSVAYALPPSPKALGCDEGSTTLCVVGVGTNSSLAQAQLASMNSAVEQIAEQLVKQVGGDATKSDALRDFVERAAFVSTVVEKGERGQYQYLTVLRLNPKLADPRLVRTFALESRVVHAGMSVMLRAERDPFGGAGPYWGIEQGRLAMAAGVDQAVAFAFDKLDAVKRPEIVHGDLVKIRISPDGIPVSLDGTRLAVTTRGSSSEFILEKVSRAEGDVVREGDSIAIRLPGREPSYLSRTRTLQFDKTRPRPGEFVVVIAPRLKSGQ